MIVPWVLWLALAHTTASTDVVLPATAVDAGGTPVAGAEFCLAESKPLLRLRPQVLARGQADGKGRFQVRFAAQPEERYREHRPYTLWAWAPGKAVAWRSVPRDLPGEPAPLRVKLGPAPRLEVRVLAADGTPAAGVRVSPAVASGRVLPEPLADQLAAHTDARGHVVLSGLAAEDVTALRLVGEAGGIQQHLLPPAGEDNPPTLRLSRTGRVQGRVTAADPRAARGLTLYASTKADPSDDDWTGGFAEVVTDGDGRFTVNQIAEGALTVRVLAHQDLPFRPAPAVHPQVETGKTTALEAPLRPAARVEGVVREQKTGQPIVGALVQLDWTAGAPRAQTDARGRYTAYIAGTSVTPYIPALPAGYFDTSAVLDSRAIPAGAREVTARPYLLARGVSLRGRVIGEHSRPVPGAAVWAVWTMAERDLDAVSGHTDKDGSFVLPGVDPRARVRLSAYHADRASAATVTTSASTTDPITLTIAPGNTVAMQGRILEAAGKPVAGAVVRLRSRVRSPNNFGQFESLVQVEDRETFRTGADGRFHIPPRLPPDREYRAEVEAWGFTSGRTEWVEPARGRTASLPDVVLSPVPPLREVAGRVVDRQGKPISGAEVFQSGDGPHPTRSRTDPQGRFRLGGVFEGRAFLFVRADGFRFQGHAIEANGRDVELALDRRSEGTRRLATLPPVLPRDQERALAQKALAPVIQGLLPQIPSLLRGNGLGKLMQLGTVTAKVDPAMVLDLAERLVPAEYGEYVFLLVAEGLLDEAPEEALAVAEMITKERWRAHLYIQASDRVPTADRARKKELLDTALLYARSDPDPVGRLDGLGYIARRWLDLGERDRAVALLREGQAYAAALPPPGTSSRPSEGIHARGRFAAQLARIDIKAALELAEGFRDEAYNDWYIGGVALVVAERDPAEAERISTRLRYDTSRLPRLCGRMAPADLARARALVGRIDDAHGQADALARMARALAPSNPEAAATVLEDTLAALEDLQRAGRQNTYSSYDPCTLAGSLLPVAERLGPDHLERCFWRALALRPPRPARGSGNGTYEGGAAQLALVLARYDRAVARAALEPAARRLGELFDPRYTYQARRFYAAATMIDPHWALSLVEAAPDRTSPGGYRPRDEARQTVAEVLAQAPASRWDYLMERVLFFHTDSRDDER
jgi:hypothetical protein